MCGFAGFWDPSGTQDDPRECLAGMAEVIAHRGPDDQQIHFETRSGLGLAHRRLSIIDLSREGRQPMESASGRFVIAYNGEVYNFREIATELDPAGGSWRGHSDTEVILAAVERYGLEKALERFVGMFALALWDREEGTLHLVRDRLGIKPLYWGRTGNALVFGSDLASFRRFPGFRPEIDRDALCLFLRHNYVPAPWSIYAGVHKLPRGHLLTIPDPAGVSSGDSRPYWSASEVFAAARRDPFAGPASAAVDGLEAVLSAAVECRLVADVPLGAFLSGGVDSSSVVALMQAASGRPVKTFSIGFDDEEFNEAEYAAEVARHLGTDHTELYVTHRDSRDVIPALPGMFTEPFADSSQLPTFLVSRLARTQVTVSLSGDGGDELFAGYHRYNFGRTLWRHSARIPAPLRAAGALAARAVPVTLWDRAMDLVGGDYDSGGRSYPLTGDRIHKMTRVVDQRDFPAMYRALVSGWKTPADLVVGGRDPRTFPAWPAGLDPAAEPTAAMMFWDLVGYLPDDILVKVDRASMAVSLEARVPMLDHRVVEYAAGMPFEYLQRDGQSKWILRRVLDRYVPPELIDRPKRGFSVPLADWLRGPLRDWAEDLLAADRLRREGYLRPGRIRKTWREFLAGRRQWQTHLWGVLMFQAWLAAADDPARGDPS